MKRIEHRQSQIAEVVRLYHNALETPQPASLAAGFQSQSGVAAHRRFNEGEALARRGLSKGAVTLLDMAVERYISGLSERTPAVQATLLVGAIADTLRKRFEFSRDVEDVEDAVSLLKVISENIDPANFLDRDQVNVTAATLVDCYYAGGGKLDQLDKAVELGDALLLYGARDPSPWRYSNTAAGAYSARYSRDGRIADLVTALKLLWHATEITPKDHPDRPTLLLNSSEAGLELSRITGDDDGITLSRGAASEGLSMPKLDEYVRPRLQIMFAESLMARRSDEGPMDVKEAMVAVEVSKSALESAGRSGLEIERVRVTYGNALVSLFHATMSLHYLREAIKQYQFALTIVGKGSPNVIPYRCALATALRRVAESTRDDDDVQTATEAFRNVWRLRPLDTVHIDLIRCAQEWGSWALRRRVAAEAIEAYSHGVDALQTVFPSQAARLDKESWLRASRTIPPLLSFAFASIGDGKGAMLAAEAGRAVLLTEKAFHRALTADNGLDDAESAVAAIRAALRPDWVTIEEAASAIPLCYVTPTTHGGFAVILSYGGRPTLLPLPEFTVEKVGVRAALLRSALQGIGAEGTLPAAAVRSCCEWLWTNGINKVQEKLLWLGIDEVALLAAGSLVGLPLHAAMDASDEYFIDQVAITYVPAARTLLGSGATQVPPTRMGRMLIVDEPRPVFGGQLRLSAAETTTIREIAKRAGVETTVLSHERATKDRILTELVGADAFHFSGHAVAEPGSPELSRLEVAPSTAITVADLRPIDLKSGCLVTLSACESAVVGRALPEEAIGLPGSLLEAGAAGVLGTLWEVRDSPSVSYVLAAFHENRMVGGMAPHRAMAGAVRWIHTSDRASLVKRFPTIEPRLSSSAAALGFVAHKRVPIDEWSAFIYNGL